MPYFKISDVLSIKSNYQIKFIHSLKAKFLNMQKAIVGFLTFSTSHTVCEKGNSAHSFARLIRIRFIHEQGESL